MREGRRLRVSRIVAADASGARTLRGLLCGTHPPGRVAISVGALNGHPIKLRPGTTDAEVAVATVVGRCHLPPPELRRIRSIWDIGANVGLTTADLAERYQRAQIVALEPHPANFELAVVNVAPYADRCILMQSAAWTRDGRVRLEGEDGPEDGYRIDEARSGIAIDAVALNTLLLRHGPHDYVKLDIEGGEARLLTEATQWSAYVRCISVECHPPYSLAGCEADLDRLGFLTVAFPQTLRRRGRDCVIGMRRQEGGS